MNRRTFLRRAGLAAGALAGAGRLAAASATPRRRLAHVGLELYTVRRELARDAEKTLAAVKAIGYEYVEVVWPMLRQTPAQFRAMLDRNGLRAPSGHISPSAFEVGWERRLEAARVLGHQYLFVASLPSEARQSIDDWRDWAGAFNKAAAVARRHEMWLGFHTEPDHFEPIGGRIPYDVFVEHLDPALVRLQLDVGNVAMAGRDPLAYLTRWRDRYWSFHVKDVPVLGVTRDTTLGAGKLDLARILGAAGNLDRRLVYVEEEGSSDALASARLDYQYLAGLELK